jgi:hypothetical protein
MSLASCHRRRYRRQHHDLVLHDGPVEPVRHPHLRDRVNAAIAGQLLQRGYPGRNSSGFCGCGTWDIQHLKPQAALIQTWSSNEPWTRKMADLSFARAMAVADTARRNRCVPILVTPAPAFGTNPEAEAHRQRNRSAAAQAGGYRLDLDTLGAPEQRPTPIDANMIGATRRFVARISSEDEISRGRTKSAPRIDFHVRRTYSGRPSSSMRFSDATAMATSVVCRPPVRERSASLITRL